MKSLILSMKNARTEEHRNVKEVWQRDMQARPSTEDAGNPAKTWGKTFQTQETVCPKAESRKGMVLQHFLWWESRIPREECQKYNFRAEQKPEDEALLRYDKECGLYHQGHEEAQLDCNQRSGTTKILF